MHRCRKSNFEKGALENRGGEKWNASSQCEFKVLNATYSCCKKILECLQSCMSSSVGVSVG